MSEPSPAACRIPPDQTADAVKTALEIGYRHIDTAEMYQNERGVGQGIRDAGLDRCVRAARGKPPPANSHRPVRERHRARDRQQQLPRTGAGEPGQPDDLTAVNSEIDPPEAFAGEPGDLEDRVAGRSGLTGSRVCLSASTRVG